MPHVDELVQLGLRDAKQLSNSLWRRYGSFLSRDELLSECYWGLMLAARAWESYCNRRGYSPEAVEFFVTYSRRRMNGAVIDKLRSLDTLTRDQRDAQKKAPVGTDTIPDTRKPPAYLDAPWTIQAGFDDNVVLTRDKIGATPYSTESQRSVNTASELATELYLRLPLRQRVALAGYELCPIVNQGMLVLTVNWGVGSQPHQQAKRGAWSILREIADLMDVDPVMPPEIPADKDENHLTGSAETFTHTIGYESLDQLYATYARMIREDPDVLVRLIRRAYATR